MPSSRTLGAALLLGVMPLIQDSYSFPAGGLSGVSSSARHGMSITQRIKKSHIVQPRSVTAEEISQHVNQIIGTSSSIDIGAVDTHPGPKEKPDGPVTSAGDPEKAPPPAAQHNPQENPPPAAEHKPQEKNAPDSDVSKGGPSNQGAPGPNGPAKKDNGLGHEPNTELPDPDDDALPADAKAQVDKKPQPDNKAPPHGDDHNGGGTPQKQGGPEAYPPPPADLHKPPHPSSGDEHSPPGPNGPERVKTQTTEIAVIAGIRIERIDSIFPPSTPAHPPVPAGGKPDQEPKEHPLDKDHPAPPPAGNGHGEPKDHPAEKDHPTPPPAENAHVEPKEHSPAPEAGHGPDHTAEKDPGPKQIELPGGIRITNDSKPGNPAEAGPRAIRITTDKLKIELSL